MKAQTSNGKEQTSYAQYKRKTCHDLVNEFVFVYQIQNNEIEEDKRVRSVVQYDRTNSYFVS